MSFEESALLQRRYEAGLDVIGPTGMSVNFATVFDNPELFQALETTRAELKGAKYLSFTDQLTDLKACRVFIVTVPTPAGAPR